MQSGIFILLIRIFSFLLLLAVWVQRYDLGEYTQGWILALNVGLLRGRDGKIKQFVDVVALADDRVILLSVEGVLQNAAGIKIVLLTTIRPQFINQGVQNYELIGLNLFAKALISSSIGVLLDIQELGDELW